MRRLVLAIAALATLALPAAARPLSGAEQAALDKTLASFASAMMGRKADKVIAVLPPRVLNFAAAQSGMEMKALRAAMTEQMNAALKSAKFSGMTIPTAGADATDSAGGDGKAITWTVLTSQFDLEVNGAKQHYQAPIIALNEGGKWYVLRIEPGTEAMLEAIYPFLKGVRYPEATVAPAN